MQLTPIVLIAAILLSDRMNGLTLGWWSDAAWSPGRSLSWTLIPFVVMVAAGWLLASVFQARMKKTSSGRPILQAFRVATGVRFGIIAWHIFSVFSFEPLRAVRAFTGNGIAYDETLLLIMPILGFMASWAMVYPLERHVREVTLVRMIDEGRTVHPMPGLGEYLFMQLRTQMLPLLLPLLLIMGLTEVVETIAANMENETAAEQVVQYGGLAVTGLVFLAAPLLVRLVLSVESMRRGPLRDRMVRVCEQNGVRVRDVMIWRTSGAMINAAVMGLIAPLRYVMLTDALVDSMSERQLTAVMAHEIGHVRKHHMVWLLIVIFAILLMATTLIEIPLRIVHERDPMWLSEHQWVEYGAGAAAIAVTIFAFGWVSRRFERQADAFAVRHLSMHPEPRYSDEFIGPIVIEHVDLEERGRDRVTPEAVYGMQSALGTIARLNMVPRNRRSWRHGSIAWRQEYLGRLAGLATDGLPIDRVVRRIKLVALGMLAAGLVFYFWPVEEEPMIPSDMEFIEYILHESGFSFDAGLSG